MVKLRENAVAVMLEAAVRLVTQRVVEQEDAALLDRCGIGTAQIGPGKRRYQQKQRQRAQQKQDQVAQAQRATPRQRLIFQEAQRGKPKQVRLLLAAQMQPDRRRQRQGAKPKPRIQKRERHSMLSE